MEQPYAAEQVQHILYEAGRTLMALRVSGCWPASYRSGMPECLRDWEDLRYAKPEVIPSQPTSRQITAMDQALRWVSRLPGRTPVEIRNRKIVLDRMLTRPDRDERRIYSWRRLGEKYGISHLWAKLIWESALIDLTAIANRELAASCSSTLARIRAASLRPLPAPCARTVSRARTESTGRRVREMA